MDANNLKKAFELFVKLQDKKVKLSNVDGKIKYRAPSGIMTNEVIEEIRKCKNELLTIINCTEHPEKLWKGKQGDSFPLTDVQSAYLIGRKNIFQYGNAACHIYMEVEYSELDSQRVEEVWNILIKRHPMLRVIFSDTGIQKILRDTPWYTLYTNRNITYTQETLQTELGHKIYDASKWPMFDIGCVSGHNKAILGISIDFMIADWASIWILIDEFEKLYQNPTASLPRIEYNFSDYIYCEKVKKYTPKYFSDREYWIERLAEFPEKPDLPIINAVENIDKNVIFKRYKFVVEKNKWKTIQLISSKMGLTSSAVILSAYAMVISKWSTNKKFVMNLTTLNRNSYESKVNNIVGDFTSINLLAVDFSIQKSFREYVKQIQQQLLTDMEHKFFSGVEVLRELSQGKENIIMPYVFTSGIGVIRNTKKEGYHGKYYQNGISQTPQVFIDCQVFDQDDELLINWDVREGIFLPEVIDEMFLMFQDLICNFLIDAENWNVEKVTAILNKNIKISKKKYDLPSGLLYSSILEMAELCPEKEAVQDENEIWSFSKLVRKSWFVQNKLQQEGCIPGDLVGIFMPKSNYQIASVLGVLMNGCTYVPIDIQQPKKRINEIIEQAGIKYVLISSCSKIELMSLDVKYIYADKQNNEIITKQIPQVPNSSIAYVIFTSGSTGKPKGVAISHLSALNTIYYVNKMLNISTNDIVFGVSRLSFDLSVYDIFGILSAGGKLFLPDENRIADPSYLFETIVKQKITVWNSVPAIMQMILEYRENEKRTEQFNIRCSLLSGDWIPLTLPERLISACMEKTRVISLGGATEAAIWSIYYEYEYLFDEWKSIPYGKALPNQEVYVLDSKKEICPLGAVGDIFISGIGLAKGYLNEPLLTEKAFIMVNGERMYDTGDKGKYLEDGNIEFLGRRDTQVKLNGFRVELGEIEANIEKIKSVKYAAVLCREKGREKRVIAYVEPQPSEFTEDFSLYVLNELKRMLPAYMIPYNIRVMKLPLTSNGKIDRKYLKNIEIVEDKKETDTKNTINSDSSTYFPIKEIWCKLLQRSDIRPDSDLRSFGADSLIMAQAVGKIRNFLKESGSQCDVPFDILLKQTINSPTLSEIVSYIDQIILKKEVNSRYEDAEVNEEELGKLKIHKKGKEDKLVVIFHAGLGSIDEFLPFIQGLCNEEKGTIVSIALNNVKQYLDFYAGHLYESVADKYTKIILDLGYDKIQLIGHCVGGMIAFEVAKNMMDKGVDVIDVSLIDSIPGKYSIEDEVVMELMFLPMVNITYPVLAEYQLNERELYEYMDEKFGKYTGIEQKSKNKVEEYINGLREIEKEERIRLYINSVSKNMPIQMFVYLFDIFKQSTNGAIYKPIPYLGDIRLFIAEDTEKIVFHRSEEVINFWRENCIGDVTVIMIPGNHLTCFTDVNNIQKLVNMITEK